MTLALAIRILNYAIAFLALSFAGYEAREYFNNNTTLTLAAASMKIGAPLLAGILSVLVLVLTQKNDARSEIENKAKEDRLRGTITSLESQLSAEARVIRTLTVVANVHFSGDWDANDLPFSDQYYIAMPEHMMFVSGFGSLPNQLSFYGTKMYRFIETPGGHRVFAVEGAIRPGTWPLGQNIDVLSEITSAMITMPITAPAKLKKPEIRIHSALVQFTVNDRLVQKFVWEETENQRQVHTFSPPNPNFDNRIVNVNVFGARGLKDWKSL